MKVCIYGCGYFGLTIASALALTNNYVYCIDKNDYRIANVKEGILDTFEPYIKTAILKSTKDCKLKFYDKPQFEDETDVYIIAVGTKERLDGSLDIDSIKSAINEIVSNAKHDCTILIKSTLSIGDMQKLKNEFKSKSSYNIELIYSPEFFSQGSALEDFLTSDRVIITKCSTKSLEKIKTLYKPITDNIIEADDKSTEIAKLANDAFLATKISYINEIANISSKIGADINVIKNILRLDKRIGSEYMNESIGYGGASLSKSVNLILHRNKNDLTIIKSAKIANENQKRLFIANILKQYNYNIEGKVFCIWGLSFKENTSDIRESASNTVIDTLIRYGATIKAYDPKAINNTIKQYKSKEEALMSSNALIILTPWDEFNNPDFEFISKNLSDKLIFDARNLYLNKDLSRYGLKYNYIGKYDV